MNYSLYIETGQNIDSSLSHDLDKELRSNFYYDHARRMGQLESVRIFKISNDAHNSYYNKCLSNGQRLGDIKHQVFQKKSGWNDVFEGSFLN